MKPSLALPLTLTLLGACGRDKVKEVQIPMKISDYYALKNPSEAPPPIASAARAVVRIQHLGGWTGTGFFLNQGQEPLLVTNNHVVGDTSCAATGCVVLISDSFEFGRPFRTGWMRLSPVARDTEVDVAYFRFQALTPAGEPTSYTPLSALTLAPRTARELVGSHIHVVGHPEGAIKKWSQGQVVQDVDGYALHTAFSTHGNSGSPILNDKGEVVGILHSGSDSVMSLSSESLNVRGYQSPSSLMLPVLEEKRGLDAFPNLETPLASVTEFLPKASAFAASLRKPEFSSGRSLQEELLVACESGLDLPFTDANVLAGNVQACATALDFIECNSEPSLSDAVMFCPAATGTRDRWEAAILKWAAHAERFPGSATGTLRSRALLFLDLSNDNPTWKDHVRQQYVEHLQSTGRPMNFERGSALINLATSAADLTFGGTSLVDTFKNYAKVDGYWVQMPNIINGLATLRLLKQLGSTDAANDQPLLALLHDPHLSLSDRLRLETRLYRAGLLR